MRSRSILYAAGVASVPLLMAGPAPAHHSFAKFDTRSTIEIVGEVTGVEWRNPHVLLTLSVTDDAGAAVDWTLETSSPGMLARMDVTAEAVRVGDTIRVAGNPAVDGGPEMFATNLLLPSGEELLLRPRDRARWATGATIGEQANWFRTEGDPSNPDAGLFRVWSSTFAGAALLFPDAVQPDYRYPFTEQAQAAVDAFDRVAASAAADCTPKGMPQIMEQPYNVAFEQAGEDILMRIEEYDVVRTFHMTAADADPAPSPLGYSVGRWEDGALVVETSRIDWPWFRFGIPQSESVALVERFTPSPAGDRLDYEMVATDPATFTEPIRMQKYWLSFPGEEVAPYDCQAE